MDLPIRGNLMTVSASFPEIADRFKDWIVDKALDKTIDALLDPLTSLGASAPVKPGFLNKKIADLQDYNPPVADVSARLSDFIKLAVVVYYPFLEARFPEFGRKSALVRQKFNSVVDAGMKSRFGQYKDDICRLMVASKATKIDLAKLRVVKKRSGSFFGPGILFEEARRYYSWSGTLVDARLGNIFSGLDYSKEFTLYLPGEKKAHVSGDFDLVIRKVEYQ